MKKTVIAILAVLFGFTIVEAAQYHNLGNVNLSTSTVSGGLAIWSETLAQIQALAPSTTGQIVFCSNCTTNLICISTGTANAGEFASVVSSSQSLSVQAFPCK